MNTEHANKKKMYRAYDRYCLEGKAKFTANLQNKSDFVSASLFNISPKGTYLESATAPDPNSLILIKIEDLNTYPFVDTILFREYLGNIRWVQKLNSATRGVGMGVMFISNVCTICEKQINYAHNEQFDRYSLLCKSCYQNLSQIQGEKNRELVEDFFNGNVI